MALSYDPAGRLSETSGSATTRFLYDGQDLVAEYDGAGNLLRRYVHGPGEDEPLVWYEGGERRFLLADERGSVNAVASGSGGLVAANTYDEYGAPAASNQGRFGYTGQTWLPEAKLYHYKARAYSPRLGRFMQPDPIGYADGLNLYAYVGNDPVNNTDPLGLRKTYRPRPNPEGTGAVRGGNGPGDSDTVAPVTVTASRCPRWVVCYSGVSLSSIGGVGIGSLYRTEGGQGAGSAPGHFYKVSRRISRPNTKCSSAQASSAVNRNIVPGNYGNHQSGRNYSVVLLGGIRIGTIGFHSFRSGTIFQNVTNSDHVLREGNVTTTISGNQNFGFGATVVGQGSNLSDATALANQIFGPLQFANQLSRAEKELKEQCGG